MSESFLLNRLNRCALSIDRYACTQIHASQNETQWNIESKLNRIGWHILGMTLATLLPRNGHIDRFVNE